jgi:hypothetical protein
VWSKLPFSRSETVSSFLSAGKGKAETLTLGVPTGSLIFKPVATVFSVEFVPPFNDFGREEFVLWDAEIASLGLIDRIDADEGFRWNGESKPDGILSNLLFRLRRAAWVDV